MATDSPKFMVDSNVGKLAQWLRMMGYDALFFDGEDDSRMIATALREGRVILTRDTQIMKRRVVTTGRLSVIFISSNDPGEQMRQVVETLNLDTRFRPFSVCLECNHPLEARSKQQVRERVPPYVFKTQDQYMECPICHRIYWRGTHWEAMNKTLAVFRED